ncbi:MAG: hypothetical protein IJT43_04105 [Stomatobaculum sp.]|nr:hypothetical protein [Stomatobaculum sp.]
MNITRESETRGRSRRAVPEKRPAAVPRDRTQRTADRRLDLLLIGLLFAWTFFVNRKIRISGYYMDDLYMWSCWGEQSFLEYVFPVGSTRCRFVYWLAAWAELLFVGNHISWVVPVNLLLNAGLAAFLYLFMRDISRSRLIAFFGGIMFIVSRFAYYQVGQLLGMMETMGLFFAVLMAYCLYRYLNEEAGDGRKGSGSEGRFWYAAVIVYFLNCFTHERYMVLLPMFFFALLVKKERDGLRWAAPVLAFALMLLLRKAMIGSLSPAGTGGTQVAETITKQGVVVNFVTEFLYLLGINAGPEHLNGLPWAQTPVLWKILVLSPFVFFGLFLCMAVLDLMQRRKYQFSLTQLIVNLLLFSGFLLGCAVSSAVTIRVEMRWIYVMYAFALLFIAELFGARKQIRLLRDADPEAEERFRIADRFPALILGIVMLFTVMTQLYYRNFWPKIYLFPNQERYNSLADVTYGKYGKEILGKEIVIIGNSYEMSDFTAETFFKTFDPERTGQGTTVTHVDSMLDFGQVTENMLVLKEDPAHNSFTDATDLIRSIKLGVDYGYYRDGWMDEKAHIRIMTGESGEISMHVMYPGNLKGNETITIVRGGKTEYAFNLRTNEAAFTLTAQPRQIVELEFRQNFYVENAAEQRGEDRLSMLVEFTTK